MHTFYILAIFNSKHLFVFFFYQLHVVLLFLICFNWMKYMNNVYGIFNICCKVPLGIAGNGAV